MLGAAFRPSVRTFAGAWPSSVVYVKTCAWNAVRFLLFFWPNVDAVQQEQWIKLTKMKFAEHLTAHITPEWRKQYINYEVRRSKDAVKNQMKNMYPMDIDQSVLFLAVSCWWRHVENRLNSCWLSTKSFSSAALMAHALKRSGKRLFCFARFKRKQSIRVAQDSTHITVRVKRWLLDLNTFVWFDWYQCWLITWLIDNNVAQRQ